MTPAIDEIYPDGKGASALLINACREHPYLPVSLLHQEFMEAEKKRWNTLSLPELNLQKSLDGWTKETAEEAKHAVTGRYFETGEKLSRLRRQLEENEP